MHPNVKKGAKGVYSRWPATQLGIRMGDPFWRSSEVTTCSKLICFSDWDNLLALILFFSLTHSLPGLKLIKQVGQESHQVPVIPRGY